MTRIAIFLIMIYQKYISKYILVGKKCRFYPTCSEYSLQAYTKYGFLKGTWLTTKRLSKCHPFHDGGYDPLK